ncbi:hypothetical protein ONZ45_g1104 [Pleurotus djamor]|nr:hypothetical protein ONZ45_g1104 [Pleurotus djamor]
MSRTLSALGVSNPFDPKRAFLTSPFLSPFGVFVVRAIFAAFSLSTCIAVLVTQATTLTDNVNNDDQNQFLYYSYFTSLTFIGLTAYFVVSSVHSGVYAWKGVYLLRRWGRIVQLLHVLLFSTIATYPLLVTVVYWALLASPATFSTPFSSFSSISQHILNSVLALTEILVLSNVESLPWLHLPICIVMLGCYLGVAYITHASQGVYVYSFLDPGEQGALLAAYIIGIGVGECVAFVLAWALMRLRVWFVSRRRTPGTTTLGEAGDDEKKEREVVEVLEDWEEVEMSPSHHAKHGHAHAV